MLSLAANGGPGAWNDPCLLLGREGSGKEDQTDQQSRFQFTAWALLAAPMLLSQSVVNMSASRLETYLNAEVIAVGQDKRGAQGVLLAGGALSLAPRGLAAHLARRHNGAVPDPRVALDAATRRALRGSAWAGGDGNTPVTLAACAAPAATSQVWAWNVSGAGYLSNAATDLCLNIDDCGSALIAFTCVTAGGTCCGAACYDGLRYTLGADGALRSPAAPGQCVTGAPLGVQLALAPCTGVPAQRWAHNAAGQLVNAGGGCLTVGDGAPARTAVIGRPLIDGSWALGLFNAGLGAADVVCDATCLAGMGFEPGQGFAARDLYAHADLPNVPAGANVTALALPGDGGVALIKLTPLFDAPLPPPPAREL
jgi:alpha-galactosidase